MAPKASQNQGTKMDGFGYCIAPNIAISLDLSREILGATVPTEQVLMHEMNFSRFAKLARFALEVFDMDATVLKLVWIRQILNGLF